MSSYRQHLYHIVFRTKDSLPTIRQDHVNDLYTYITGITKHMYILIEKYTTFSLKSIPLIKTNQLLWSRSSNTKQDDKYGFETRDYKALFTRG